jgi:hypothetical protein
VHGDAIKLCIDCAEQADDIHTRLPAQYVERPDTVFATTPGKKGLSFHSGFPTSGKFAAPEFHFVAQHLNLYWGLLRLMLASKSLLKQVVRSDTDNDDHAQAYTRIQLAKPPQLQLPVLGIG